VFKTISDAAPNYALSIHTAYGYLNLVRHILLKLKSEKTISVCLLRICTVSFGVHGEYVQFHSEYFANISGTNLFETDVIPHILQDTPSFHNEYSANAHNFFLHFLEYAQVHSAYSAKKPKSIRFFGTKLSSSTAFKEMPT
jgi:hypothetical protein